LTIEYTQVYPSSELICSRADRCREVGMRIILNEKSMDTDSKSISELLLEMSVKGGFVAVAKNEQILPRSVWNEEKLNEGDRIDIIAPVGGG
jgi:sulfur carrier protein